MTVAVDKFFGEYAGARRYNRFRPIGSRPCEDCEW